MLLLLSRHTWLSKKSFQQLRQRTDSIPVLRREKSRLMGEAAWFWKQTHPKMPRMQSCWLQLSYQHHLPGTTGAAVPRPCAGRAPLALGILRAGWCPPPPQLVSSTTTALVTVWNCLHVLPWSSGAREGPRRHSPEPSRDPPKVSMPSKHLSFAVLGN